MTAAREARSSAISDIDLARAAFERAVSFLLRRAMEKEPEELARRQR
jgi:hypothetical protein